jgi:hypothetical protein
MSTLMQASRQWATRPEEERFTSLDAMAAHFHAQRAISRAAVVSSRHLRAVPDGADGLLIDCADGFRCECLDGYLRTGPDGFPVC